MPYDPIHGQWLKFNVIEVWNVWKWSISKAISCQYACDQKTGGELWYYSA